VRLSEGTRWSVVTDRAAAIDGAASAPRCGAPPAPDDGADAKPGAPAGAINGGLYPCKEDWPAQCPSVAAGLEDIRAAMTRVTAAGAQVLSGPMPIPGVGDYPALVDTEGDRHSMLQPTMA
jgi:hypothetical protein